MKVKCEYCGKDFSKFGIHNHIRKHLGKPGPAKGQIPWNKGLTKKDLRIANSAEKLSKSLRGKKRKPLSEKHKNSISKSMKKAHIDGRAWNIGKSRWNNEPSYPEKFFMEVIENEFDDKNYKREFNVGIYSIDFAWPHLKLAIEIDGDQHQRFKEYQERDIRKDTQLKKEGWKILRISWKEMMNDSKKCIKKAKNFIPS